MNIEYIAGLFDGEGCVQLIPQKNYALRVVVTLGYLPVLEKLEDLYKGSIYETTNKKQGYKPCWQWQVACKQAEEFLKAILPFLIVKKQEVEYALLFRKRFTKRGNRKISYQEQRERKAGLKYFRSLR